MELGIDGMAEPRLTALGTEATIYEVDDEVLGRPMVVKVFDRFGHSRLERFQTDLALLAALPDHPGLALPHRFGVTAAGLPYVAVEPSPGGSLKRRLSERGPLSWDEAIRHLTPIARGLQAVHDTGVRHGSIRPSSIRFAADGTARLGDFGLAGGGPPRRFAGPADLAHLAPELLGDDRSPSVASDLYALVSTLYFLITGLGPHEIRDEDSIEAHRARIVGGPTPGLGLGQSRDRFLAGALAKDPSARPVSGTDLGRRLEALVVPPLAPPPPAPGRQPVARRSMGWPSSAGGPVRPRPTAVRSTPPMSSAAMAALAPPRPHAVAAPLAPLPAAPVLPSVPAPPLGRTSPGAPNARPRSSAASPRAYLPPSYLPPALPRPGPLLPPPPSPPGGGPSRPWPSLLAVGFGPPPAPLPRPGAPAPPGQPRPPAHHPSPGPTVRGGRTGRTPAELRWTLTAVAAMLAVALLGTGLLVFSASSPPSLDLALDAEVPLDAPAGMVLVGDRSDRQVEELIELEDGRFLQIGRYQESWVWDPDTDEQVLIASGRGVLDAAPTVSGGAALLFPDGSVELIALDALRPNGLSVTELFGVQSEPVSIVGLPDGRLATAGSTGAILLWDPQEPTAAPELLDGHRGSVVPGITGVGVFGPDLLSTGADGSVRRWDLQTGAVTMLRTAGAPPVLQLTALSDGTPVTVDEAGFVQVWEPGGPEIDLEHLDMVSVAPGTGREAMAILTLDRVIVHDVGLDGGIIGEFDIAFPTAAAPIEDGLVVAGDDAIWIVPIDGSPRPELIVDEVGMIDDLVPLEDGSLLVLRTGGSLERWPAGSLERP